MHINESFLEGHPIRSSIKFRCIPIALKACLKMLLQIAMKVELLSVVLTARLAARFKYTRQIGSIQIAVVSNRNLRPAQPIKRPQSSAKAASTNQTINLTRQSSLRATYFKVMTMVEPTMTVNLSCTLQVKLLGQANSHRISNSQICSR